MPPEKRLEPEDRHFYARLVMTYLTDLGEARNQDLPPPPTRISNDPLVCCIQDYNHIPGYLDSIADYEHRAVKLDIFSANKSRQLLLVPRKGLGFAEVKDENIPDNAKIIELTNEEAVKMFRLSAQEISDEIDLSLYALNIDAQNRHIEAHPGKHPDRCAGGDRFNPLPKKRKPDKS